MPRVAYLPNPLAFTLAVAVLLPVFTQPVLLAAEKVTVIAGKAEADKKPGELNVPFGMGKDAKGTIYINEFDGGRIFKLLADGKLEHIAGDGSKGYTGDGGPAAKATFNGMHNITVSAGGDIYVGDTHNHCVRKIDGQSGVITTIAGTGKAGYSGDGGPATEATFNGVFCIMLSPQEDQLIITDLFNRRVRAVELKSGLVSLIAGDGKKGVPADGGDAKTSPLADPRAAVMDSAGNIYILERGGHALRVVSPDGKIRTVVGTGKSGKQDGPGPEATMNGPKHLCIDRDDSVIIADAENHLIRRYDPKTGAIATILDAKTIPLHRPHGVYVDRQGVLFVVDSYHHRVLRVER